MSLYERGLKMSTFAVADRIVQAAGYRLDIVTQVNFWPHSSPRVGRCWVPDRLWRGTLATYSAAGQVRRDLEAAGFAVERRAGFGRKRHMSVARLD